MNGTGAARGVPGIERMAERVRRTSWEPKSGSPGHAAPRSLKASLLHSMEVGMGVEGNGEVGYLAGLGDVMAGTVESELRSGRRGEKLADGAPDRTVQICGLR